MGGKSGHDKSPAVEPDRPPNLKDSPRAGGVEPKNWEAKQRPESHVLMLEVLARWLAEEGQWHDGGASTE
jgi:hypothetical protein